MSSQQSGTGLTPAQAIEQLEALYEASVEALRQAVGDFINHGGLPDAQTRAAGLFVYPELRVSWDGKSPGQTKTRAYGRFTSAAVSPLSDRTTDHAGE